MHEYYVLWKILCILDNNTINGIQLFYVNMIDKKTGRPQTS